MPVTKNKGPRPANAAPDWGGEEDGEELPPGSPSTTEVNAAPVAPPIKPDPASQPPQNGGKPDAETVAAAKELLQATKEPLMHPGWEGGNVTRVTATPQPNVSHPDPLIVQEDEGLPEPEKKVSKKFILPDPLPTDYAECYRLFVKLNGTPVDSEVESEEKMNALAILRPHFHEVQQGTRMITVDHREQSKALATQNEILKRERRVQVAKHDLVVKEMLDELDALATRKPCSAETLYETYCAAVGGKAFNGDLLPKWKEFSADPAKQLQVRGWIEVARLAAVGEKVKISNQ